MTIEGVPFFCSWSGGKDSCLALHRAIRQRGRPMRLLTMLNEDGAKSRSHGLSSGILTAQAESVGIPLETRPTTWGDYEENFLTALEEFRKDGIEAGVFGDIDLEEHREWTERVCASARMKAFSPLWQLRRRDILDEFLGAGYKAVIVSLKQDSLDESLLGRYLSAGTIDEIEKAGADACGEGGEYHTLVVDGPIFSAPVQFAEKGVQSHDGYSFLELASED
ncbi:MAG TPA: diphthine--ammonia ligase [Thermoplasmata archaeon]|nr:diphthine--ammonia ligase [Thermoplasmata archaeon]